jgi:hypothetical protein
MDYFTLETCKLTDDKAQVLLAAAGNKRKLRLAFSLSRVKMMEDEFDGTLILYIFLSFNTSMNNNM